ncbi:hypothetical protein H4219_001491 [Mycoemilia scoparia]|uniref:NADH dehydrogenase [ubiquinone] 1 beta subcomplex subunit 2 n=1 Tax=Mycoemilia scoparia TaxID=417184 RepID=A0A9W8DVY6_9FUNG|nr:hypothetical protein H4219_001491 [Mycoemilia scoparia]
MPAGQYGGYTPPKVPGFYRFWSKAIGATAFFWMMYCAKQDLPVVLGLRHPWDGHGHHHIEGKESEH